MHLSQQETQNYFNEIQNLLSSTAFRSETGLQMLRDLLDTSATTNYECESLQPWLAHSNIAIAQLTRFTINLWLLEQLNHVTEGLMDDAINQFKALITNPEVIEIQLNQIWEINFADDIEKECFFILCKLLETAPNLKIINMKNSGIELIEEEFFTAWFDSLKKAPNLLSLTLANSSLGLMGINNNLKTFADAITESQKLEFLNIGHCRNLAEDEQTFYFCETIKKNITLKVIYSQHPPKNLKLSINEMLTRNNQLWIVRNQVLKQTNTLKNILANKAEINLNIKFKNSISETIAELKKANHSLTHLGTEKAINLQNELHVLQSKLCLLGADWLEQNGLGNQAIELLLDTTLQRTDFEERHFRAFEISYMGYKNDLITQLFNTIEILLQDEAYQSKAELNNLSELLANPRIDTELKNAEKLKLWLNHRNQTISRLTQFAINLRILEGLNPNSNKDLTRAIKQFRSLIANPNLNEFIPPPLWALHLDEISFKIFSNTIETAPYLESFDLSPSYGLGNLPDIQGKRLFEALENAPCLHSLNLANLNISSFGKLTQQAMCKAIRNSKSLDVLDLGQFWYDGENTDESNYPGSLINDLCHAIRNNHSLQEIIIEDAPLMIQKTIKQTLRRNVNSKINANLIINKWHHLKVGDIKELQDVLKQENDCLVKALACLINQDRLILFKNVSYQKSVDIYLLSAANISFTNAAGKLNNITKEDRTTLLQYILLNAIERGLSHTVLRNFLDFKPNFAPSIIKQKIKTELSHLNIVNFEDLKNHQRTIKSLWENLNVNLLDRVLKDKNLKLLAKSVDFNDEQSNQNLKMKF